MAKETFAKQMQSKHLVTLSLGGVIGTGIFMSSGYLVQSAGPIGTLAAYIIGAILVCLVMLCLGELSVHKPTTGSFHTYASQHIHPAVGFVVAWLYWLTWTVSLGSQLITLAMIANGFYQGIPIWSWCVLFIILLSALNLSKVKWFAASELVMSIIKSLALLVFIVIGLALVFGVIQSVGQTQPVLFSNFTKNGVLPNGILPVISVILAANFAFSGTEIIAVAAGETKNPQKVLPGAILKTLIILVILFIGAIFVIGALLRQESSGLTTSPFVSILNNAGFAYAGNIMSIVLFITVLSGANSGVYAASRMIWSLADQGPLPKKLAKLNKNGLPIYGLTLTLLGGLLSLFSSIYAPGTVYLVLTSLSGFAVVSVWLSVGIAQLRFRKQFLKEGHKTSDLKYKTPFYPIVPWAVIILCVISLVGIGFDPEQQLSLIAGVLFSVIVLAYYYIFIQKKETKHVKKVNHRLGKETK
ncbi:amino acid permease [Holzapfeliella floricola]|uniref:Amino acid transport protein n=1 Tax=Holzapfeliella floricola DSM 23037 = JCM 16512 TaxID=1423744 RepID=A0A0R2DJ06_9LACO|nr:amino acid permease [Holzapfeliella floricola]KRN04025.1 amino acid transport protein [Holzapfeliella floricola DSM 23037 = JCM 16512]